MKITKIENSAVYKVVLNGHGAVIYMLDGSFHRRGGQPALITDFSADYFYRGVKITREISEGKLSVQEVLKIPNMEIRQRAMEILGYESFLQIFKKIHSFTPSQFAGKFFPEEMYALYELTEKNMKEPIKILQMYDPSKIPFEKYFIRVKPNEINCCEAVAHSYQLANWEDYIFCKAWV